MRGKRHVAFELKRYIEFFHGARAKVFEIKDYQGEGGNERLFNDLAQFFGVDPGRFCRKSAYAFEDSAVGGNGGFAIILTNEAEESTTSMWSAHTKWHRRWIAKTCESKLGAEVVFIQITVDEDAGHKYVADLAAHRGKSIEDAMDIIAKYQDHYVPIQNDGSEQDTPYIKLINYNQTIVVNRFMRTFVGAEVCHFLACLHPYQHTIYLSRHGESEFNVEKRIGGDSSLSQRGKEYARRLAEFVDYVVCGGARNLVCVTLTQREAAQLRAHLCEREDGSVCTSSRWANYGNASGAVVAEGMRLVRLQRGFDCDFEDAPRTVDAVLNVTGPCRYCTLIFIEGDASHPGETPGRLWTSSLRRTIETAAFVRSKTMTDAEGKPWTNMLGRKFRNLDEVYAGEYDGLSEEEIERAAPDVIAARKRDKLGFRYPRGESYYDVIARLDSVMNHLERIRCPVLLISHQAVLRVIISWLLQKSRSEALDQAVLQHGVVRVSFDGLGGPRAEAHFMLGPDELPADVAGSSKGF